MRTFSNRVAANTMVRARRGPFCVGLCSGAQRRRGEEAPACRWDGLVLDRYAPDGRHHPWCRPLILPWSPPNPPGAARRPVPQRHLTTRAGAGVAVGPRRIQLLGPPPSAANHPPTSTAAGANHPATKTNPAANRPPAGRASPAANHAPAARASGRGGPGSRRPASGRVSPGRRRPAVGVGRRNRANRGRARSAAPPGRRHAIGPDRKATDREAGATGRRGPADRRTVRAGVGVRAASGTGSCGGGGGCCSSSSSSAPWPWPGRCIT
jgi:hypothetical protein